MHGRDKSWGHTIHHVSEECELNPNQYSVDMDENPENENIKDVGLSTSQKQKSLDKCHP